MRRNGDPLFSTTLDAGRECQVLMLSCRFPVDPRTWRRINGLLQQLAGLTHYGASAPRLFYTAPLMYDVYRDTLLFYWLVPPERTCIALKDLAGMLERSVTGLRERQWDAGAQMLLHAARFTIDPEGRWRSAGKEAFITAMTGVQDSARGGLTCTDAFIALQRTCPEVAIPALPARTG